MLSQLQLQLSKVETCGRGFWTVLRVAACAAPSDNGMDAKGNVPETLQLESSACAHAEENEQRQLVAASLP